MWYRVYRPDPMDPKKRLASEGFPTREKAEVERRQVLIDNPRLDPAEVWISGTIRAVKS